MKVLMRKIYLLTFFGIGFGATVLSFSKADFEKVEKAIASSKIDKVRSLLKSCESKNLPSEDVRTFLEQFGRIAHDVATDRKEKVSLKPNLKEIFTESEHEKASDIALIGMGGLIAAVGCWYGRDAIENYYDAHKSLQGSEYYSTLVFDSGMALWGVFFGGYLAYKGYKCEMQQNSVKAAQQIEEFLYDQADILELANSEYKLAIK
jgi:hypothetical protein